MASTPGDAVLRFWRPSTPKCGEALLINSNNILLSDKFTGDSTIPELHQEREEFRLKLILAPHKH